MNYKIQRYLNKIKFNSIAKNYRFFIVNNSFLFINYYFWLNNELFTYQNEGFCIKQNKTKKFQMDSFLLYYFTRNMKINQLFFSNSPFIFFLKKFNTIKKNRKIFLL